MGEYIFPRERPEVVKGVTKKIETAECGSLYVTVTEDEKGICDVFLNMGRSGGCRAAYAEVLGVLVSLLFRCGVDPEAILRRMRGVRCSAPSFSQDGPVLSCPDAAAKVIAEVLGISKEVAQHKMADSTANECPECGNTLEFSEGCVKCAACGYSKCG